MFLCVHAFVKHAHGQGQKSVVEAGESNIAADTNP